MRYRANPIEDAISSLIEQKTKEYKRIEKKLGKAFQNLKLIPNLEEEQYFIVLPREEMAKLKALKALEEAQTSFVYVGDWIGLSRVVSDANEAFERAAKRGIKIRFITEKPKKKASKIFQNLRKQGDVELRYRPIQPSATMVLIDCREAFFFTGPIENRIDVPCLWSNNNSLLKVFGEYFDFMWFKEDAN
jgi:sugar-specific transcriptional regulator TrmB